MRFKDWRVAAGLTMGEVAKLLELSQPSVSRIENGEQWPSRATMERIAIISAGKVTANDFAHANSPAQKSDESQPRRRVASRSGAAR